MIHSTRLIGSFVIICLGTLYHVVNSSPQKTQAGYDGQEGGYSSRNWGNLYKHGSPSKKIGGLKPFAQFGPASFYLRSSFGPYYVIGKWKDKFPERRMGFTLNEWDKDRELDGFLCRNKNDCVWADPLFDCQQYDVNIEFLKGTWRGWSNGTRSNIAGECACKGGFYFDDISLSCRQASYEFNPVWMVAALSIFILFILLFCRFGIFCIFRK